MLVFDSFTYVKNTFIDLSRSPSNSWFCGKFISLCKQMEFSGPLVVRLLSKIASLIIWQKINESRKQKNIQRVLLFFTIPNWWSLWYTACWDCIEWIPNPGTRRGEGGDFSNGNYLTEADNLLCFGVMWSRSLNVQCTVMSTCRRSSLMTQSPNSNDLSWFAFFNWNKYWATSYSHTMNILILCFANVVTPQNSLGMNPHFSKTYR